MVINAANKDVKAQIELANLLMGRADAVALEIICNLLRDACDNGEGTGGVACFKLGEIFSDSKEGRGYLYSRSEALKWYKKGGLLGHQGSLYMCGTMHAEGMSPSSNHPSYVCRVSTSTHFALSSFHTSLLTSFFLSFLSCHVENRHARCRGTPAQFCGTQPHRRPAVFPGGLLSRDWARLVARRPGRTTAAVRVDS